VTTTEQLEDLIRRTEELAGTPLLILQSMGKDWMLEISPANWNQMNNFRIIAGTIEEAIEKADQYLQFYENPHETSY
jgi:hypothetical protein